ncbi:MAG TPA: N-acetyltransferase [Candidatus Aquicultor sp.]|jgi:putative acetyltransferase
MVRVRPESENDYPAVYEVNKLAFGQEAEAQLVEKLRVSSAYIPDLSLVALEDDTIVGHILFSKIEIETQKGPVESLALAPVAVIPERQNHGIGSELIVHGLRRCQELNYNAVIVLGHAEYYPRFGFVPATTLSIKAPFDVPDEVFMALELKPGALSGIEGTVLYPPAFMDV